MRKGLIIFAAVGLLAILLWAGCKSTRGGYERPKYRVVEKDGIFETRDYPVLIVAETSMPADGMNSGFNKLFRFITGGNSKTEKIAMTTPVLVNPASSNSSMAFVMPGKYVLSDPKRFGCIWQSPGAIGGVGGVLCLALSLFQRRRG